MLAQMAVSAQSLLILGGREFAPRTDRRAALYHRLENQPWSLVVAPKQWATLLVDLTSCHLQLCLRGAVLIDPSFRLREGMQQITLPLVPLAYPTVVITDTHRPLRTHVSAWSSRLVLRDLTQGDPLQTALRLLQDPS